jgi:predicted lipid-binding transport protein (Tim44 family)
MGRLLLALLLTAMPAAAFARAGGGGGCFPAGTPIETTEGSVPIEKIEAGSSVLAFSNESLVQARVKNTYSKQDRLLTIRLKKARIVTTSEHPFLTPGGFVETRNLKAGDEVARFLGGRRVWESIRSIKPSGVATVYNLEVDPPHTFIAGGFIVHNKGGGFHSSGGYRGGYSRRSPFSDTLLLALMSAFLLMRGVLFVSERRREIAPPKDKLLSNGAVSPRAEATLAVMRTLGASDPAFEPGGLEDFVRDAFLRLQAAWQARDYGPVRDLMTSDLYAEHSARVEAMKDRGEVDRMEDLKVLHVDFVHVRRPQEAEGSAFTALITASAKDYIVNEETGFRRSVAAKAAPFQEFWSFYRSDGRWVLARIDQTAEAETILNAPNLPEKPGDAPGRPFSAPPPSGPADDAAYAPPGYERASAPAAAAGAAMTASVFAPPAAAPDPADGRWNRQKLEIAATLAFENVYSAWARNDGALVSGDFVAAGTLARIRKMMDERKAEGITFEFRDLFTRRAEVVLTSPAENGRPGPDEFTARLTGTALRTMLRRGKPLHSDTAPAAFTEYWVFAREGGEWKLRDILPRMDQEKGLAGDGAPSPAQLEWYWESEPLSR